MVKVVDAQAQAKAEEVVCHVRVLDPAHQTVTPASAGVTAGTKDQPTLPPTSVQAFAGMATKP
jgi:hypothetical protein